MDNQRRRQLRAQMRTRRRQLSRGESRQRSQTLARHIARLPLFARSRHIALYLPNDGEIDLTPLIVTATSRSQCCYLPVLSPHYHNRLWFAPYRPGDPLRRNRFGIPEPTVNYGAMRSPWSLDLVITPLVAFDNSGNRLGMGGGYYDRTFAYLHRRHRWHKPPLLGAAYSFQQVDQLPANPWDVPLQQVISDTGVVTR